MLTIKSRVHDYSVEEYSALSDALHSVPNSESAFYLVDQKVADLYPTALASVPTARRILLHASEEAKSMEAVPPLFPALLDLGLKRNSTLVVVGGGVLQDIGCFIASVMARGIRWELIPTTLLAQADSCIGSKSSLNAGAYKNMVGTFYPPHRVMLVPAVLSTLPMDELHSGLGEIIKLQLLSSEEGFLELIADLKDFCAQPELLSKWVSRSMEVKKPFIEEDEYDQGIRNLLNYGHTFGHAYESATHYQIPHGIAVILGILTATGLSAALGMVAREHYESLLTQLLPFCSSHASKLIAAPRSDILGAMKKDKKNTGEAINCILTRGIGKMERIGVSLVDRIAPAIDQFIVDLQTHAVASVTIS